MAEINFRKLSIERAAAEITSALNAYLAKGTVLLSLSGGSAIAPEIEILSNLKGADSLTITLNDERYGEVGHPDSNWHQLKAAGLDELGLKAFEILKGQQPQIATEEFSDFLEQATGRFDYCVSILGMGADGHTSGILPGSPALDSPAWATYYEAVDHRRITNTPLFLAEQAEIWVLAYGNSKYPQVERLGQDLPVSTQPVQIIKQAGRATFYNDYKGEDS
jgi:6-phosphogluconolactonase/glucosamine-6-phosphate isomerase/deaminase